MAGDGSADESILETKIVRPPVRGVVRRPRLYERLDAACTRKLTVVSAPAGYGKTTLVASWLVERSLDCCWLSLGELDSSPRRVTTYLAAALDRLERRKRGPGPIRWEALLNTLADRRRETVIVLDDYHLAERAEVNDLVMLLLENLPRTAHLVIITRTDPTLRLAKLRGQGELVEVRQSDLAFTLEESRAFLADASGVALANEQVQALSRTTEGWVAGLRMLAPGLKDSQDPSRFIADLGGHQRYLRDYLVEEVVSRLDPSTREFLERCSILERLSADLCDAVTGRTDSRDLLSAIDRQNLFISPLDEERRWFRMHQLFADVLLARLQTDHADELAILHQKASQWFDAHHHPGEAINHEVASGDAAAAGKLIDRHGEWLMKYGEMGAVAQWIRRLPEEVCAASPVILLLRAWAGIMDGRPLERIEQDLRTIEASPALAAHALCLRSYLAGLQGDDEQALRLSRKALGLGGEQDLFVSGDAKFRIGVARFASGSVEEAVELLEAAANESLEAGNLPVAVAALAHKARALLDRGELESSEQIFRRALDLSMQHDAPRRWFVAMALIGLGEVSRHRGSVDAALDLFREGLEASQGWTDLNTFSLSLGFALALVAGGRCPEAVQALQSAEQLARRSAVPRFFIRLVSACRVQVLARCGRLEEAHAYLAQTPAPAGKKSDVSMVEALVSDQELLARAGLMLRQGNSRESAALANAVARGARRQERGLHALQADLVLVQALWLAEEVDEAVSVLQRALSFAAERGIVQPFIDEGPALARILYRAREAGVDHPFIGRLLAAFPLEQQAEAAAETQPHSVERLTTREVTVLTLLSQGLSNKEVAAKLFLSVRTVKWYTSSIYAKLGVASRTQAIARARQLEILP